MKTFNIFSYNIFVLVLTLANGAFANGPDPQLVSKYKELIGDKEDLNLERKRLTDDDAKAIAEILKTNKTLKDLSLKKNHLITDVEVNALAEALKKNNTLKMLNVNETSMTVKGLGALSDALKKNLALTSLNHGVQQYANEPVPEDWISTGKRVEEQLEFNKNLPELLRKNWDKIKLFFIGHNDEGSVLKTVPKDVILKIISTVLDLDLQEKN